MATPVPYKFYLQMINGVNSPAIYPAYNPPPGSREVTFQEFKDFASRVGFQVNGGNFYPNMRADDVQRAMSGPQFSAATPSGTYFDGSQYNTFKNNYSTLIAGAEKGDAPTSSGYSILNGVFVADRDLERVQADLASGAASIKDGQVIPSAGVKAQFTPTSTVSGSSAPPVGTFSAGSFSSLMFPTTNLQQGSTGAEVKKLQDYLVSKGLMTQAQVDTGYGTYGPQTKVAVAALQKNLGLQVPTGQEGFFGPLTIGALGNSSRGIGGGIGFTANVDGKDYSFASQSDLDLYNNVWGPFMEQMKKSGQQVNPLLDLGDAMIARILEKAKEIVHPQYAQQINVVIDDLKRSSAELARGYESTVAGQQAGFTSSLLGSREDAAGAGTVFSGGRGYQEQNMQNIQNRSLDLLSQQYGGKFGELATAAEKALGYSGFQSSGYQMPTLNRQGASLEGRGTFSSLGGLSASYTPGIYQQGTIPQSAAAAALALRNANVEEASRRKAAGLSYADLYS